MSLSFNGSQNQANINENWLFDINHSGGNLYLALADVTHSSNFYYGAITNNPSVRESLDLVRSVTKTSNLTITVANFEIDGTSLSEEVFNGSNYYINRPVSVSVKIGADNPVLIGTFRILDLSFDGDVINIQMASKRPWDNIELPTDKSETGVYVPVVYGDYLGAIGSSTTVTNNVFMDNKKVFPVPRTSNSGTNIYFLAPKSYGSGVVTNYFDSRADLFVHLEENNAATVTRDGKDAFEVKGKINRTYKFRPKAVSSSSNFSNTGNAINTDQSDGAVSSTFTANGQAQIADIKFELPSISGNFTQASLRISATIVVANHSGNVDDQATLSHRSFGSDTTLLSRADDGTATLAVSTNTNILTLLQNNNDRLPDDLELRFQLASTQVGTTQATCTINDVYLYFKIEEDFNGEPNAAALAEINLDTVYSGNDGLTASWDSSAIDKIQDIHRDLLIRFAGVTTSTPDGYSDLDTARSQSNKEWFARFWQLQPLSLQDTLEKLQFEGGFVFRFKSDDSPQYLFVKDSYSSADHTIAKNDISKITISNTPIGDLLTKYIVNYEKHPGNNTYIKSQTSSNDTSRTNFNIATKENISQVNLDYLVSNGAGTVGATDLTTGSPNDGFANYYGYLVSNVKLLVEADIVNPALIGIEVGDIVKFDNTDMYPEKAFASDWTNKAFMVVGVTRRLGKLSARFREVGVIS